MLDIAAFRLRYPEFGETSDILVQAALDDSWKEIDETVWLELADKGHGLLTAHTLADGPFGNSAKLKPEDADGPSTVYERRYRKMVRMVAAGIRSF